MLLRIIHGEIPGEFLEILEAEEEIQGKGIVIWTNNYRH